MLAQGMIVRRGKHVVNIVYLEGSNPDFTPNTDTPDRFNDRGLLIVENRNNHFEVVLNHACTTEPGLAATWSRAALLNGGVARITTGQQTAWRPGFHRPSQYRRGHPALVQAAPVYVHRDRNRDMRRTGDIVTTATGINHHGTRPGWTGKFVGMFSMGCMVRPNWADHMDFFDLCIGDEQHRAEPDFLFPSAVLDGGIFYKWVLEKMKNDVTTTRKI